eukprot:12262216-Heterocapsa_arctica.AAC.1
MAVEVRATAETYEHGDYLRAALAEILPADFSARRWKQHASALRQNIVIDDKAALEGLESDNLSLIHISEPTRR